MRITIGLLKRGLSVSNEQAALLGVLALAFTVRVAWILLIPTTPIADFAEYDRLGWQLASEGVYANLSGQPTAYRPPGYPFLLALLYRVVGHQPLAARLFNAGVGTLTCLLLFQLTVRSGLRRLALPVTALYALYPTAIYYTNLLATEVLFTFLFVAIILVWLEFTEIQPAPRLTAIRHTALTLGFGGLSGMAALVRPVILPVLGLFLLFRIRQIRSVPHIWQLLVLSLAALLVVVMPWTYRNYRVSGRLVLISTNGGVNFFVGNNLSATGEYFFPADSPFAGLSEWEMGRASWKAGTDFIRNHPLQFIRTCLIKALRLFSLEWDAFFYNFQTPETFAQQAHSLQLVKRSPALIPFFMLPLGVSAGLMVLGLLGLKQTYGLPGRPWLVTLVGVWIAVHVLFFANARFHFPLVPLLAISAVHSVHGWLRQKHQSADRLVYWFRHAGPGDYVISLYTVAIVLSWGQAAVTRVATYLL